MVIEWNPYGKVSSVQTADKNISIDRQYRTTFGYGPDQNRWAKHRLTAAPGVRSDAVASTYYVRDAQGSTLAVYGREQDYDQASGTTLDVQPFTLRQQYLFGSSRLGEVSFDRPVDAQAGPPVAYGTRQYELTNHLGNVTTVFSEHLREYTDYRGISFLSPEVVGHQDYLAFGLNLERSSASGGLDYRYAFNGKELDNEGEWGQGTTTYDYGFRIYNPGLARFLSVDPLTRSYPMLTPYQFAGNTPIQAIDVDGLEPYVLSREGAQRIANDVNAIFFSKYGDEKAKTAVVTITEVRKIANPDYGLWDRFGLGTDSEFIEETRTYLAANEDFNWEQDRYTRALRDILDPRADEVEIDIITDRRVASATEVLPADLDLGKPEEVIQRANDEQWAFIREVGGGDMGAYGSGNGPVKLSNQLLDTEIGSQPSSFDYTIGGMFMHEFIYHLHPLGREENRRPQLMRSYFNIATNNNTLSTDHPAGDATSNMFDGVHLNEIKQWIDEEK